MCVFLPGKSNKATHNMSCRFTCCSTQVHAESGLKRLGAVLGLSVGDKHIETLNIAVSWLTLYSSV